TLSFSASPARFSGCTCSGLNEAPPSPGSRIWLLSGAMNSRRASGSDTGAGVIPAGMSSLRDMARPSAVYVPGQDRPAAVPHASPLQIEIIDSVPALRALAPEWQRLLAASGIGHPFATFEWMDSWWTHLRQETWAIRDTLEVRAVRGPAGD